MSESASVRRAPPSPLVFSLEPVLPPAPRLSNNNSHGSGSNTVSMPFVRRHVTRRLKAAKAECDKELQRVTNNITAFFEERLRDGDHEREADREFRERERERERDRDSQMGDTESIREALLNHASQSRPPSQAVSVDDASSDGGYEAELESGRHSRQRAFPQEDNIKAPTLTHWSSFPILNTASTSSSVPAIIRRQNTLPWDQTLAQTASSSTTSVVAIPTTAGETPSPPRKQTNASMAPPLWSSQGISRRLSRTIHIPSRPVRSGQSSRSTSRSRSPLPPNTHHNNFSDPYNNGAPLSSPSNHRSSRILVDDPIDPIMTALYDIIGVATDIIEMSITQLTAQPKVCEALVQRIQNIGKAWDEHPDWHGRNWYVQVLLAVASLSRVVEWWEAEKSFWNFDDNDDEQDEPLTFVMKPAEEPVAPPVPTPTYRSREEEGSGFRLIPDEENKLRLTRPTSQGRKSRDEVPKDLSMPSSREETHSGGPNKMMESARVLATERLRLQAETAQNQNIVMELSLDGDHFIWVNYAWRVVVGWVVPSLYSA
jgi:serine/threonine-protein kinase RIM15